MLSPRLAAGDHRGEEDPGCQKRGRHPEDRELHVPGANQVVRQHLRQVYAKEAREVRPVVLRGRPDERLEQKQRGHHQKEPPAGPLGGRQRYVAGRAEREGGLLASVPAEEVPPPEGREKETYTTEQRDQGQHTPHHHVGGRLVTNEPLWRPVVSVRVVLPGPQGRCRPGGPGEVGGELPNLLRIAYGLRPETVAGRRLAEELSVVLPEFLEGRRLWRRVREGLGLRVVAVLFEGVYGTRRRPVGALTTVALTDGEGGAPQVVGGVVGA